MRISWLAWAILIVLISSTVYAESQPSQAINQRSSTKQTEHRTNYGTEEVPLFIKIVPTPKNDIETQRDESERKHKSYVDIVTIIIALMTAVILTFQLFVFSKQAQRLKETIDEMKVATKATQEAANAATAQTAVAVKEFISTHRPRLIVRSVSIKPHTHPSLPIEPGKPVQIEWAVVNVGASNCEITESNATAILGDKTFEARTAYSKDRDTMGHEEFLSGGAFTYTMPADDIVFPNEGTRFQIMHQEERGIYFFGFIEYKDSVGTIRRTAFCRRYDADAKRFVVVNDPDYEYTD